MKQLLNNPNLIYNQNHFPNESIFTIPRLNRVLWNDGLCSPSIPSLSLSTPFYSRSPNLRGYTANTMILGKGKGYGKGPAMVVDSVKSMAIERRFIEIPSRIEQRRSPGQEFQFRPFQMTSSLLTIMTTPNYIPVSTFHGSQPARNQAPAIGFRTTCTKVKKE